MYSENSDLYQRDLYKKEKLIGSVIDSIEVRLTQLNNKRNLNSNSSSGTTT